MSTPLATALPYGLRDLKLTPYSNAAGSTLGTVVVDLPNARTLSFSGGDIHAILYRCRATDSLEGEFNDGEFFLTSGSGQALPLLEDGVDDDILYDIIQNETAVPMTTTALTLPDPEANDAP
jgi:hypothetical protein